jgi:predicted CXXCH cytochrome family protein
MLLTEVRQLCASCHGSVTEAADAAAVHHAPVQAADGCTRCHTPHASNVAPLLLKVEMDLCLSCHDRPLPEPNPVLGNMKELFAENREWRGPIQDGACGGCHEVHGGGHFRLLAEHYPAHFYSPFRSESYALCFQCHEESAVTEQFTTTMTGFRDGDRNLHYVHVNREHRGRTCRSCHEVHAGRQPLHVRESVPYGAWELPIEFEQTGNGGSCRPGCHEPFTYDRTRERRSGK